MAFPSSRRRRGEFEDAALPHLEDLYRTALYLTRDAAAAEDVVQDTYLRAWRSFSTYEPGTNCRAWLLRILANVVHDLFKRRAREPRADHSERILERRPDRCGAGFIDPEVIEALEDLPPAWRAVVLLADVQELTYRETAEALDVPVGTVMSRLSRARARLRQRLTPPGKSLSRERQWASVGTI